MASSSSLTLEKRVSAPANEGSVLPTVAADVSLEPSSTVLLPRALVRPASSSWLPAGSVSRLRANFEMVSRGDAPPPLPPASSCRGPSMSAGDAPPPPSALATELSDCKVVAPACCMGEGAAAIAPAASGDCGAYRTCDCEKMESTRLVGETLDGMAASGAGAMCE